MIIIILIKVEEIANEVADAVVAEKSKGKKRQRKEKTNQSKSKKQVIYMYMQFSPCIA